MVKTDLITYNYADQYIQTKKDFGETTFYNIGTNTSTVVPWGHLDWLNFAGSVVWSVVLPAGIVWAIGHGLKVWQSIKLAHCVKPNRLVSTGLKRKRSADSPSGRDNEAVGVQADVK